MDFPFLLSMAMVLGAETTYVDSLLKSIAPIDGILIVSLWAVSMWILPLHLGMIVSEKKSKEAESGFFLGLFLSWIGVVIALMIPQPD